MSGLVNNIDFRYTPLAVVGTYLTAIVYLTYAIAAGLYASYKSLGPAQDTRSRYAQRRRLVPIFLGLAAVAFSLATYNSVASAVLSYKTWAHEHGVNQRERYSLITPILYVISVSNVHIAISSPKNLFLHLGT